MLIFIKRERGGVVLICLILIGEVSSFVVINDLYVETCDFPVGLQPASFHKITKQEGKCPYVL